MTLTSESERTQLCVAGAKAEIRIVQMAGYQSPVTSALGLREFRDQPESPALINTYSQTKQSPTAGTHAEPTGTHRHFALSSVRNIGSLAFP
ncbi:hypothetical protein RRG08_034555 [Elysia crispata]|uniref:Uncharacterized protein n=1 Tax=Elysia crispata TaxID=231223 RepID=A0AAE1DYG0_9GAST|nr:hypothetical protein RRG08_034555 [Elysia crispata]